MGKGKGERGSANGLRKYERDQMLGSFAISYEKLRNQCPDSCFAVALLVGIHYVRKTKAWEMILLKNKKLDNVVYEQLDGVHTTQSILVNDFPVIYKKN